MDQPKKCPIERFTAYWCDGVMGVHIGTSGGEWNGSRLQPFEAVRGDLYEAVQAKAATLDEALKAIDAIRNDIIGRQAIDWSRHIYPLVKALQLAGYDGAGYDVARAKAMTDDELVASLRRQLQAADRLAAETRACHLGGCEHPRCAALAAYDAARKGAT
jgi:hypothetical protein